MRHSTNGTIIEIIDRGRGKQLSTCRITVQDVYPYVERGDTVCLLMRNRIEHYVADLGALLAGAVPTSLYLTSSPDQLRWLLNDSRAKVILVDGEAELERVRSVRSDIGTLLHVVPGHSWLGRPTVVATRQLSYRLLDRWLRFQKVDWPTLALASVRRLLRRQRQQATDVCCPSS